MFFDFILFIVVSRGIIKTILGPLGFLLANIESRETCDHKDSHAYDSLYNINDLAISIPWVRSIFL